MLEVGCVSVHRDGIVAEVFDELHEGSLISFGIAVLMEAQAAAQQGADTGAHEGVWEPAAFGKINCEAEHQDVSLSTGVEKTWVWCAGIQHSQDDD